MHRKKPRDRVSVKHFDPPLVIALVIEIPVPLAVRRIPSRPMLKPYTAETESRSQGEAVDYERDYE